MAWRWYCRPCLKTYKVTISLQGICPSCSKQMRRVYTADGKRGCRRCGKKNKR